MNVLIVDDEQAMRELVSRWLTSPSSDVFQAGSADEAIAVLEQHEIAVVLCDRSMPGRDGDWLVAQIRHRFPAVAVILATADDAVPARVSLQDGVVGYLVKPFQADQVRGAVRDAIAWHQAANTSRRQPREARDLDEFLKRVGRPSPKGDV